MADEQGNDQPRRPHDLEGLLKFCMEVTKGEDAPPEAQQQPMDPERRKWLEEAIAGMTVDVVKQLTEAIKILGGQATFDADASEDDLEEVEMAFEAVEDWCGNIDMANNFHKIEGFQVLKKVLTQSPHAGLRANAANAVAEMAQNNPYCQENFVKDNFLPSLLDMMENDPAEGVRVKCLYATSSIVRDFPMGMDLFVRLKGADSLLRTIQQSAGDESAARLRTKACFFVASVCQENADVRDLFCRMGFARQLVAVSQFEEWNASLHEQSARALHVLLQDNPQLQSELRDCSELNIRPFVERKIRELEGKPEAQEEREYYVEIQKLCKFSAAAGRGGSSSASTLTKRQSHIDR